jgi:hypothetical protein
LSEGTRRDELCQDYRKNNPEPVVSGFFRFADKDFSGQIYGGIAKSKNSDFPDRL